MSAHRIALVCLAVPALGTGGCGSDSSSGETAASNSPAAGGNVGLRLSEYTIRPQVASEAIARAGSVTFEVSNDGSIPHDFVVLRTERPAADLLRGTGADETGEVGRLDAKALAVGAQRQLSLDLKAGHYALICDLPGHYQGGMHLDLTVK